MSAEASGIRWATCSPERGLGTAPDQREAGDHEALAVVEVHAPARRRHRRARRRSGPGRVRGHAVGRRGLLLGRRRRPLLRGHRLRLLGGRGLRRGLGRRGPGGAGGAWAGAGVGRGSSEVGGQRLAAHGVLGALGRPHLLDGRRRDEPHRGEVDDVARAVVDGGVGDLDDTGVRRPRRCWSGGRASRGAGGRGPPRPSRPGWPGRCRRWAVPRRPARASGAAPGRPRSGCRCRGAPRAGRSPPCRATSPVRPSTTASTSQRSTVAPATAPTTVHRSSETNSAVATPDAGDDGPGEEAVDGEGGEASFELGDGVGHGLGVLGHGGLGGC